MLLYLLSFKYSLKARDALTAQLTVWDVEVLAFPTRFCQQVCRPVRVRFNNKTLFHLLVKQLIPSMFPNFRYADCVT